MLKKYLVVASKKDKAGINITTALSQFRPNPLLTSMKDEPSFDFYLVEEDMLFTENLNMEKINQYDFIIFASKHQSEKKEPSLSVHAPGNWRRVISREKGVNPVTSEVTRDAEAGGESEKVCPTSAQFQKQLFTELKTNAKEHHLEKYKVTLECTHHGPLINKPCVFIEIGSSDFEWNDRKAAFVVAKTISDTIKKFQLNPYREVAIGLGGPHYCPNFNKIQANSNIAISHIIPQYIMPINEEMIKQAITKTTEEVDLAIIDWKGLGTSEQRKEVLDLLDKLYIRYEKTSDINK